METEKIYKMPFAKLYPLLVNKAVKKGRSTDEVNRVISWLTGYSAEAIAGAAASAITYGDFFRQAPAMHPNRALIQGTVCGVRVETIEEPLLRDIRALDKLIDELAKGRPMEKILRTTPDAQTALPDTGRTYAFQAVIETAARGGAYVRFPHDLRRECGRGRARADITFDGAPYRGSIVNMGVKNADGSICYIIGIRKDIRAKIGKQDGDTVAVTAKLLDAPNVR